MSTNPHHRPGPPPADDRPDDSGAASLRPSDGQPEANSTDAAMELIRRKLAAIYQDEPDAAQELAVAEAPAAAKQPQSQPQTHSKHQQFMHSLHSSGKPMSEIQTAWHQYYRDLPDDEKHQVWQEFYSQSARLRQQPSRLEPAYHYQPDSAVQPAAEPPASPETAASANPLHSAGMAGRASTRPAAAVLTPELTANLVPSQAAARPADKRPAAAIRRRLRQTASSRGAIKAKHHLQSLAFGLGFGGLVVLIVLFSFFNEVVIAPFIQPSRKVSATPIIVSPNDVAPTKDNEVIIPKINVQIPLDFSTTTTDEKAFESALDKGVAHYPTTALPGQQGNAAFFGHSSNNIFNPGKYKFAFVLLNELVAGDTFYLSYNGTVYSYQVYDKQIVAADDVAILNPVPDKKATAMLVTCDPPGTSLRRLAVWGQQVSPNPSGDSAPAQAGGRPPAGQTSLPGNGPTLWRRMINAITGGGN